MRKTDVKFLNVVDDRWPGSRHTIIYTGALKPCEGGFVYSFSYGTGKGWVMDGFGMVESERYSKMSPEEIELMCAVADPARPRDIYEACICGDMTKAYAEKYSGMAETEPGDAG